MKTGSRRQRHVAAEARGGGRTVCRSAATEQAGTDRWSMRERTGEHAAWRLAAGGSAHPFLVPKLLLPVLDEQLADPHDRVAVLLFHRGRHGVYERHLQLGLLGIEELLVVHSRIRSPAAGSSLVAEHVALIAGAETAPNATGAPPERHSLARAAGAPRAGSAAPSGRHSTLPSTLATRHPPLCYGPTPESGGSARGPSSSYTASALVFIWR